MSFNAENQYSASHKVWDHVGNIIPDIEHSEGERPAYEFKPAEWLPVQFYDKHYEVWQSVMPGKVVALDPDGRVMPAQYGLTGQSVVYVQNDIDAGVTDIATGLAVTTAKTVVLTQLNGTRGSAWTRAVAGTAGVNNTSGFMGKHGIAFNDANEKFPIGIAPYAYNQWAGGDGSNPANLRHHNHILQHQVAVLCDYVIKLPWVPGQAATESVSGTFSGGLPTFGTSGTYRRNAIQNNSTGRYNASTGSNPVLGTYPVIAFCLDEFPVAKNTARTTVTMQSSNANDDVSGILVNERTSLSAVTQSGDYYVDYEVGMLFIFSSNQTVPTAISGAAGTVSVTYYHYAGVPGTVSRFASVVSTSVDPGDFLVCTTNSNLVVDNTADFKNIVGQVLAVDDNFPKDALDQVRTAYDPAISSNSAGSMANATLGSASANLGQLDQMPGSATGGYPDILHYSGAADKLVLVNLVSR